MPNPALWACVVCMLMMAGCRHRPAEPTPGIESPEQTWVRVLLFGNLRECTVSSVSGLDVRDVDSGTVATFRSDEPFAVRLSAGVLYVGEHRIGRDVLVRPQDPYVFEINDTPYRGYLRLRVLEEEQGFEAVNHVPLESYLLGVVGAEMQSYWEPEALKAQAVSSRTYCLYIKDRFGRDRTWDMTRSESTQMYGGLKAETAMIRQVVEDTSGQILVCPGRMHERNVIFPAFYSSSCGGHTEAAENIFGGEPVASLCGVGCPYCANVARRSHFYWKPVEMKMSEISERLLVRYPTLEKLEAITDFNVTKLGYKSRILRVELIGKNGKNDTLRGEDFRLSLDPTGRKIRSAIFSVEKRGSMVTFQNGLGFGHGVGFCQCGAQGMARQGKTYEQILDHYFPGSKRVKIE